MKQEIKISQIGGEINKQEAAEMIVRNDDRVSFGYGTPFPTQLIGKDILMKILSQEDCQGIIMRMGTDKDENEHLVYAGIDSKGNVIPDIVADRNHVPGSTKRDWWEQWLWEFFTSKSKV